jgi:hypothetical protein
MPWDRRPNTVQVLAPKAGSAMEDGGERSFESDNSSYDLRILLCDKCQIYLDGRRFGNEFRNRFDFFGVASEFSNGGFGFFHSLANILPASDGEPRGLCPSFGIVEDFVADFRRIRGFTGGLLDRGSHTLKIR